MLLLDPKIPHQTFNTEFYSVSIRFLKDTINNKTRWWWQHWHFSISQCIRGEKGKFDIYYSNFHTQVLPIHMLNISWNLFYIPCILIHYLPDDFIKFHLKIVLVNIIGNLSTAFAILYYFFHLKNINNELGLCFPKFAAYMILQINVTWSRGMSRMSQILFLRYQLGISSNSFVLYCFQPQ